MAVEDFFLDKNDGNYVFNWTDGNDVRVYYRNTDFFADVQSDLKKAGGPKDFIYFSGWWSDLELPLGDPNPTAPALPPPTFKQVLVDLSKGKPKPQPQDQTPTEPLENYPGPQLCCMVWQHKAQIDLSAWPSAILPNSIFGASILAAINTETVKTINYLRIVGENMGILDKAHRFAGSHHQKFTVIGTNGQLVAYVGSADYNMDRLYEKNDKSSARPPSTSGAPLEDISVRITGPAALDLLKTFVERWQLHDDGKNHALRGATFVPVNLPSSAGGAKVQIVHTYGEKYPFALPVQTALKAHLKAVSMSKRYLYYECQYLIGQFYEGTMSTSAIAQALRDKLVSNVELVLVGVMSPLAVTGDLRWLQERRADFWYPFASTYPGRILLFEMLNDKGQDNGRNSYLHSKLLIVDDAAALVGSTNFSRRSFTHDSECSTLIGGRSSIGSPDEDLAKKIRVERWMRHLGVTANAVDKIADGIALWRKLPSTAKVRSWTPYATTMNAVERAAYKRFYDAVADPS